MSRRKSFSFSFPFFLRTYSIHQVTVQATYGAYVAQEFATFEPNPTFTYTYDVLNLLRYYIKNSKKFTILVPEVSIPKKYTSVLLYSRKVLVYQIQRIKEHKPRLFVHSQLRFIIAEGHNRCIKTQNTF